MIVIPVYRLPLLPEEWVSLRHLEHYLSKFDQCIVCPTSLSLPTELTVGRSVRRFNDSYFTGLNGYNRLMLSRYFYSAFRHFEYILIHQLDCLVFADQLEKWCAEGWDYIGAPWFRGHRGDTSRGLWTVGNGGFSLRRVRSALKVLKARGLWSEPLDLARTTNRFTAWPNLSKLFVPIKAGAHALGYKNTIRHFIRHYSQHEDLFWSQCASRIWRQFRIPDPETALPFSFEYAPRYCYQQNGCRLPFGCHGWYKIDPEFWQAFLLKGSENEATASAA